MQFINRRKDQNHKTTWKYAKKACDKVQKPFTIYKTQTRNIQKIGIETNSSTWQKSPVKYPRTTPYLLRGNSVFPFEIQNQTACQCRWGNSCKALPLGKELQAISGYWEKKICLIQRCALWQTIQSQAPRFKHMRNNKGLRGPPCVRERRIKE